MTDEQQPPPPPAWPSRPEGTATPGSAPSPSHSPPPAPWAPPGTTDAQGAGPGEAEVTPPSWHPTGDDGTVPPRPPGGGGNRGLLVAGGVMAVVAVIAVVWFGMRSAGDQPPPSAGGATEQPGLAGDPSAAPLDPGSGGGQGGLGGGSDPLAVDPDAPNPLPEPTPAQLADLAELFELIDDAELVMIDFLTSLPWSPTGDLSDQDLAEVARRGQAAADRLRGLREQLEAVGTDGSPDEPIRRTYLAHLQAWIDYTQAVADDPTVLDSHPEHTRAIQETADAFTASIPTELGDLSTLPGELEALIREIIERGFMGASDDADPAV